jgi:phosphatidylethanolamine-binding protein (PEBP) family uncharacterized protein
MIVHSKSVVSATIAMLFFTLSALLAHPGGHAVESNHPSATRTWTLAHNGLHLHGVFESAKDGNVFIRRADGKLSTLTLTELVETDQRWVAERVAEIKRLNEQPALKLVVQKPTPLANDRTEIKKPSIYSHFEPFEKSLELRWDDRFFYVGSNGIPDHPMMVGITAWQQQVPLPQKYFGENAWRVPLQPVPAKTPAMIKGRFLRGAIALGVNGIPIFNPQNNRGEVSSEIGELDEYGGHCGRADDYHYHLAPVHLEKIVGADHPIAFALDGFPIYGYQVESSPDYAPLDSLSGHKDKQGNYHYHATKKYPYVIGGFYGEVVEREGQVDPQPRAEPLRPALPPLRDAKIIDFQEIQPHTYRLTYNIQGKLGTVKYTLSDDGAANFTFVDTQGKTTTESYTPRKPPPSGNDRPPPKNSPPPKREPPPKRGENEPLLSKPVSEVPQLKLSSTSIDAEGMLHVDCTCNGKGESPEIAWQNAPVGTKSFAVSLWHTAPDQEKSYWLIYNIPSDVAELKQNTQGIGSLGMNGKRIAAYDPMCSKGPGLKSYHLTVYALSSELKLPTDQATRVTMLEAIKQCTLAEATLDFQYERK